MNIKELMEEAKTICDRPRSPILKAQMTLKDIELEVAESLLIAHDYEGPLPDLSQYPGIKSFYSTRSITQSEFSMLDLSSVEDLHLSLAGKPNKIKINAPRARKVSLYISDNEGDQLSIFDSLDKEIDLTVAVDMEELVLKHCTGYSIQSNTFNQLKTFVCSDYRHYDFEVIQKMPNLESLVLTGCHLTDISFLKWCKKLKKLDLSYNEIQQADQILELSNLLELRLYRNPLDTPDKYRTTGIEHVYVTDKDNDFLMFLSSVWTSRNMAYMSVRRAREPDSKRSPLLQRIYDRETDEEIFARAFVSNIKRNIEYHTSSEKSYRKKILLVSEELIEYLFNEYPFLADYWDKK